MWYEELYNGGSALSFRVHRVNASRLPLGYLSSDIVQPVVGVNTGVVARSSATETGMVAPASIITKKFENLSEENQIAHIKDASTAKYHSSE
ncbi:hypothetical protein KIN20_032408 [Parelaphostrongylus tenuis]|uniref:Uncharacterized protein n=1 Tax=Parelaphostrongylus tenuis TaxID=148309 RepID=A0AAD5R6V1_PARTN|nr:hypothetical protein KIN20_032408 [Parelaphostrongylus tenuis]